MNSTPPPFPPVGGPSLYELDRRVQSLEHQHAAMPEKLAERLLLMESHLNQAKWLIGIVAAAAVLSLANGIMSRFSFHADPAPVSSPWKVPERDNTNPHQP